MSIPQEYREKAKLKAEEILSEFFETHSVMAPIPIRDVIEEYLGDVQFVEIGKQHFADGVSAFTKKDMELGWIVAINEMECIERQRFSSAHELGHIVLIPPELEEIVYCSTDKSNWVERACDSFAGHILMPEKAVRAYCRINPMPFLEDIARAFKVSRMVAEIQLKTFGLAFRSQVGGANISF